jgi:uncharacterized integral membrane protein (TIGR00697 family)
MTLISALYVACELIANITAGRTVSLFGITPPGGVFIYALTFTLIDLINERLGKGGGAKKRVVADAFAANLLFALYCTLVLALPAPPFFRQGDAFTAVLGATPPIVIASLAAYLISSLIDVEIFDAWKRRVGGHRWVRIVASNAVSTAIDSVLFVMISFAGSLPILPLFSANT